MRKSNPGHIGERQVLSPLGQPCHLALMALMVGLQVLMTSVFRVVMIVVFLVVTVLLASADSGLVIMALVLMMMIVPAAHIAMMVLVMVMWL